MPDAGPSPRDTDGAPPSHAGALLADSACVPAVRDAVVGFVRRQGAGELDCDRIGLAVTEAAANVVMHAYPPGRRGEIRWAADIEDGDLQVIVSDDGRGLAAPGVPDGPGVGLRLIAEMTSELAVTGHDPHGVDVWMRFALDLGRRDD
jgi:anti-sigma regulatory factor (Ser/Thr protein kinase)